MRLAADAVKALSKVYGHQDKTVWVYTDREGDIQLWALEADIEPPRRHRDYPQHRLAGALDLVSGRVSGGQDGPIGGDSQDRPDALQMLWLALEAIGRVMLLMAGVGMVFILMLSSTIGTGSVHGGGRGRRR